MPLGENLDEAFAVERQGHCRRISGLSNGSCVAVHDQIGALICRL